MMSIPVMRTQVYSLLSSRQNVASLLMRTSIHSQASGDEHVIKYPIAWRKKMDKQIKSRKKKSVSSVLTLAKPGKMLVSADNSKHNMYTNEFPNKFVPPSLTSSTWTSHRSPGRQFTIHATKENPSFSRDEDTSFHQLNLTFEVISALRLLDVQKPTCIQSKAIPAILKGSNVMYAAETGSGKTLAYLLPILTNLTRYNQSKYETPYALVLTPTHELCLQVEKMARSLDTGYSFRAFHSTSSYLKLRSGKVKPPDVLITTPTPLIVALNQRCLDLGGLASVVIDECDTMFDDSFAKQTNNILNRINIVDGTRQPLSGDHRTQLIMCSATFPKHANDHLKNLLSMDNLVTLRTGYLHRVPPHITQKFIRVRPSQKMDNLIKLLSSRKDRGTIVFCNYRKSATMVASACDENNIDVVKLDKSLSSKERSEILDRFHNGDVKILIATDLASRGIDTSQACEVINYEVPNNVSDYIHRCGRVGRVGTNNECNVTTFVSHKWEVPLVSQIEEAAKRRTEIQASENIKKKQKFRWNKRQVKLGLQNDEFDDFINE